MSNKKLTKADIEKRRSEVFKMILEGKTRREIVKHCDDYYGVSEKTADRDIMLYNEEIAKKYLKKKDKVIEEHIARYEHIYMLYMSKYDEEGELNMYYDPEKASKMLEKIEKLMGKVDSKINVQYVENQQNNTINNNNILNVLNGKSTEELQNILSKLE